MNGKKPNVRPSARRRRQGIRPKSIILSILYVAFVAGSLYFGYVFIGNSQLILASLGQRLDLPIPILGSSENAPNWADKERVNILLLGVDERQDEKDQPTRSDTMLVVTIDPYGKTAGMLSIPRDLWVPIPLGDKGVLNAKINTAHFYGDYYKVPGGGPGLAKKTVEYNFGIKIHYYARVDFEGFERIVDTLGGVTVDVDQPLKDNEYPTPYYGVRRVFIPMGLQHLNGEQALQYARSRHQDSDFGRTKRQQKVLLGIRERALELGLIPKLPKLIGEFKDTVKTDMSVSEILALAGLGRDLDTSKLTMRTIEYPSVTSMTTEAGDILVPVRSEIAKVVSEVFFDPRLKEEGARVEVVNGTRTSGLATRVAQLFKDRGISQVQMSTASDRQENLYTTVISYKGKKYTAAQIASWLSIPDSRVQWKDDTPSEFDISIVIGSDVKIPSS